MGPQGAFICMMALFLATMTYVSVYGKTRQSDEQPVSYEHDPRELADEHSKH
jgi:hypothetical protein